MCSDTAHISREGCLTSCDETCICNTASSYSSVSWSILHSYFVDAHVDWPFSHHMSNTLLCHAVQDCSARMSTCTISVAPGMNGCLWLYVVVYVQQIHFQIHQQLIKGIQNSPEYGSV
jgi:hypothetical protein